MNAVQVDLSSPGKGFAARSVELEQCWSKRRLPHYCRHAPHQSGFIVEWSAAEWELVTKSQGLG